MKRPIIAIPIIIFGILLIYLLLSFNAIYYRIGHSNISLLKVESMYNFNEQLENGPIKISTLGDSLTYGQGADNFSEAYPYLLAKKIAGEKQTVNLAPLAFPGAMTSDLINYYLDQAVAFQPDIATVLIGVNDLHNHVSLLEFKENYQKIITTLKTNPQSKIYLISLPFIGDNVLMLPPYQKYFFEETKKYNEIIKTLAKENQVEYIDITTETAELFKKSGNHYSADHFHPSALGYKIFEQLIYASINQ